MTSVNQFSVVTGPTIHRAVHQDLRGCLQVVREAYLAHDAGETVNPPSVFLRFPERPSARIIALPAHLLRPRPLSGIKWIASYPENVRTGRPRASAVVILNDANSGYPFACLEGSVISAARTAASAVLAAETIRLGRTKLESLGVIGAGHIARYVCRFLFGLGWEIGTVYVHDTNPEARASFRQWLAGLCPDTRVVATSGAVDLLAASELSLFATVTGVPYVFEDGWLARGSTVLHLSLRDLAPGIILKCSNVVDDAKHVVSAGTSLALTAETAETSDFISCTLADLLHGRRSLPMGKTTVFSPFGLGVLDIAVGEWIYRRVVESNEAQSIDNFFALSE